MPIGNMGFRPISKHAYTFYDELKKDGTFSDKANIWGIGLLLGYILNRRSAEQPTSSVGGFTRIMVSYQNVEKFPLYMNITNFIFDHYAEGSNEAEKLKDLEKIAEGGIEYLMEEKKKLGKIPLDITQVIQKVREVSNEENSEDTAN